MPSRRTLVLLDQVGPAHFVGRTQAERQALLIAPAAAADAVHVDCGVLGDVHVDDGAQVLDVQPAGGHVGGDQDRAALVGELDQDLVAFALLQGAGQGLGADAVGLQPFDQVVAADLGVAEGQRGDGAEVRQQARHGVQAVLAVDFVEDLFDAAGVVLRFDLDFGRVPQEPGAELADVVGVGGRKQQRLAFGRAVRGDGDDVVIEAHVDHAVGFVQHQRGQAGQVQAAARQVVLDAAGRADDQRGGPRPGPA
ncbi:hypothetical protein G6F50_013995 [Rhizopus delemar]|uniref:Uncharacterized protein n=1 Tax=Rhizopus delemar TaxID=936053 RepID=A0A9P6YAA2_9FUNG|nr:hypothetical protein G6F50_013995 [Rhizopus delemar]